MTSARYIREIIFGFGTQTEFAAELGLNQSRISRYEKGEAMSANVQTKIVQLADRRKITFDHSLFFRDLTHKELAALARQEIQEAG